MTLNELPDSVPLFQYNAAVEDHGKTVRLLMMVREENDELRQEIQLLREKVAELWRNNYE